MLKPLYLYLCGSAFLVSLTDPDKQFFNVRSVLKFLSHRFSLLEIQSNLFKQAPLQGDHSSKATNTESNQANFHVIVTV